MDAILPPRKPQRPDPITVMDALHRIWTDRTVQPDYDKDEKRLWMAIQNFMERHQARRALFEDYRA